MSTPLNGSLLKGFAILGLFSKERTEITTAIVTSELAINTATAHRFLTTLIEAGALTNHKRGHYCLSHNIQTLGKIAENGMPLSTIVQPIIDLAAIDLNESVMACQFLSAGPTCIAVASSSRPISVNINVGVTLPIHASAQGKLWLAFMSAKDRQQTLKAVSLNSISQHTIATPSALDIEIAAIQEQGYAANDGENEEDIGAISVPVFGPDKRMILSLSAFGMLRRFDARFKKQAKIRLLEAAQEFQNR